MSGYEDIQQLDIPTSLGRRADHLMFNRDLIIEQKEYTSLGEHTVNGLNLKDTIGLLMNNYKVGPDTISNIHKVITKEESECLIKLRDEFHKKIRTYISEAEKILAQRRGFLTLTMQ